MRQMARNSQQSDFGGWAGAGVRGRGLRKRLGVKVLRSVGESKYHLYRPHLQCLVLETQELALGAGGFHCCLAMGYDCLVEETLKPRSSSLFSSVLQVL